MSGRPSRAWRRAREQADGGGDGRSAEGSRARKQRASAGRRDPAPSKRFFSHRRGSTARTGNDRRLIEAGSRSSRCAGSCSLEGLLALSPLEFGSTVSRPSIAPSTWYAHARRREAVARLPTCWRSSYMRAPRPRPLGSLRSRKTPVARGREEGGRSIRRHRRGFAVTKLKRQEHRRRLQHPTRREPRIPQPFEDQIGVQRMKLRHLRHRHTRCPRLQANRPLRFGTPTPITASLFRRSGHQSVHHTEWAPLSNSPPMIDQTIKSARWAKPDAHTTTAACSARSATSRRRRRKPATTPSWPSRWRHRTRINRPPTNPGRFTLTKISLRRLSRPLASTVLPGRQSGTGAKNRKARNLLELRAYLVAGARNHLILLFDAPGLRRH